MTQLRNPFTRSGALRLNHPLFRGRAAELDRLEQACLADIDFFLLIYGGRQNGKTTLLLRLEERLEERLSAGVRVCRVDFQSLPRATTSEAYRYLAQSVARVLPQAPQSPEMPDAPALGDFLETVLGGGDVQRLVLLLDELGALPDTTREDIAHVLRALHTRRLNSPSLAKAQFVLAGGIELYKLAVVEASALSNVCEIVRLGDLSEADAVGLIADGLALVGMEMAAAMMVGQAIYMRVSGHPYFTQRLGELIAVQQIAGNTPDEAMVETRCREILEQSDPLLEHLRHSIVELHLEETARRLLNASQRTSHTDDATERLELLGLAGRSDRCWVPRSPLLSVALAEWLHLGLPDTVRIIIAAQMAREVAIAQHLGDLKMKQEAITSQSESATSSAEQVRLQRQVNELADEISQMEAAQQEVAQASDSIQTSPLASSPAVIGQMIFTPTVHTCSPSPTYRNAGHIHRSISDWVPSLMHIPVGPFLMGSSDSDKHADDDEKPQHTLNMPDYWIGTTPTTNIQFRPFVEGDGYRNQHYWTATGWQWRKQENIRQPACWNDAEWSGDNHPVVGVSWFEAVAYCRWLSAQISHAFRLPSEAEWEKASRGAEGRLWPWSNTWETGRCNSEEAGIRQTTTVGQYPSGASPYGTLDMAGNVWEWMSSHWRQPYPYQLEDEWLKAYLEQDVDRMLRGGSWCSGQEDVRGAYRSYRHPRIRSFNLGMRVASRFPMSGSAS